MALKRSGYTDKTSKSYIINAAVIYTDVKFDKETKEFTGDLHGATSGGVNLNIEQEYRDIEVDGANHMKLKGNKILESATAKITANMKELTAESIRASINANMKDANEDEAPAGYKKIENKVDLNDDDYIKNMAVVGKLSGTDDPIVAILDEVLSVGGLELGTEDNNEAVVEQEYEAHATQEQLDAGIYPWRIFYPDVADDPSDGNEEGNGDGDNDGESDGSDEGSSEE